MSKMRFVVLGLAAASAIGAAFLAKGMIGQKPEKIASSGAAAVQVIESTEVLVAAKDMNLGEKLGDGTLIWQKWPSANIQPNMIKKSDRPEAISELKEARARYAVYQGETIIEKKIVLPGAGGFMSAILPKGMRAISVAVSERTSAGGFILPNDRVDLILTVKADGSVVTSETVLSNVRILAINQTFRQDTEGNGATVEQGKTATLELTLQQAEVIAKIESTGEISLALRSIAEADGKKLEDLKPELSANYKPADPSAKTAAAPPAARAVTFIRYGSQSVVQGE